MSIRFTEEEAKELGFRKDANGNWIGPGRRKTPRKGVPPRDPGQAPKFEPAQDGPASGQTESRKERKKESGESVQEFDPRFVISIRVYSRREIDPDNIVTKWIVDRFVEAGVLPGDSCRHVLSVRKSAQKIGRDEEEKTVVVIRELIDEVVRQNFADF